MVLLIFILFFCLSNSYTMLITKYKYRNNINIYQLFSEDPDANKLGLS